MSRGTLRTVVAGVHEQATARRLRTSVLIAGLCILLACSLVPVAPVAAQTNNETIPQCDEGPPIPGQEESGVGDVELAFMNDRSGSMDPSEMDAMKSGSITIVDDLENPDEAAAGSFNESATIDQELTTDYQAVRDAINGLQADGRNDPAAGIPEAHDELINGTNASPGAEKVLVLFSDALPDDFQEGVAVPAAQDAKDDGIRIFTIAFGDDADTTTLQQIASSPDDAYVAPSESELAGIYDEISVEVEEIAASQLTIDTRQLYQPGETHGYTVTNTTVVNNQTVTEDVTGEASVTTSNTSLLTADEQAAELSATDDSDAAAGVVVNATHNDNEGCVNVIVAEASMENLELLPTVWRGTTFLGNWTVFFLLLASLTGVVGTRLATSFMGLSMMELVLVIGWFGGYLSTGLVMVSVFACLFIGLNLAANIDYQVQR